MGFVAGGRNLGDMGGQRDIPARASGTPASAAGPEIAITTRSAIATDTGGDDSRKTVRDGLDRAMRGQHSFRDRRSGSASATITGRHPERTIPAIAAAAAGLDVLEIVRVAGWGRQCDGTARRGPSTGTGRHVDPDVLRPAVRELDLGHQTGGHIRGHRRDLDCGGRIVRIGQGVTNRDHCENENIACRQDAFREDFRNRQGVASRGIDDDPADHIAGQQAARLGPHARLDPEHGVMAQVEMDTSGELRRFSLRN